MRAILPFIKADGLDPFIEKSGILPCAQMPKIIHTARKRKVQNRASPAPEPCLETFSRLGHDLELHRPSRFLLNDGRAVTDLTAANDIPDPDLDEVAPPQLAVDRQIKQSAIAKPFVLVEIKADCPDISQFQRSLGADILPWVSRAPFMHGGVQI